jgi:hypothetical protein
MRNDVAGLRCVRDVLLLSSMLASLAMARDDGPAGPPIAAGRERERTSFQTGAAWDPGLQLPADVAMCYGIRPDLASRIKLWGERGYITHVMTGVSWGDYQDYLYGKLDGKRHVDEAQTDLWGNVISHGGDVYYMCPGPTFGDYLAGRVRLAIEAGAKATYLEEPEFLEYGSMVAATRGSAGRLWFLHDPVEDDPEHSWEDYRTNWECTVVASLFWPEVASYEIAPWPERVFHGTYPTVDSKRRKRGEPVAREPIPPAYATELLTVMNALNDMEQPDTRWDCGTRGIGVVVSDTMMFQRSGLFASDAHLGSFFGLALPLLERGLPVECLQLETAATPATSLATRSSS